MFPQVNALPSTEGEIPSRDGDALGRSHQHGTHVRRHVVRAFVIVLPLRRFGGHGFEPAREIAENGGIGIFLDDETG